MASMVLTHEPEELSEKPINSADHWTPLPKTLVLGLGLEICSTTNTSSDFLINNFPLRKSNLVKDLWTMLILEVHMCVHAHTHPPPTHTHVTGFGKLMSNTPSYALRSFTSDCLSLIQTTLLTVRFILPLFSHWSLQVPDSLTRSVQQG